MCPSRRHEATAGGSIRGGDSDAGGVTAVAVAEPAGGEDTRIVQLDPIAEPAESRTHGIGKPFLFADAAEEPGTQDVVDEDQRRVVRVVVAHPNPQGRGNPGIRLVGHLDVDGDGGNVRVSPVDPGAVRNRSRNARIKVIPARGTGASQRWGFSSFICSRARPGKSRRSAAGTSR